MPHCGLELYENLLSFNWNDLNLEHVWILGNRYVHWYIPYLLLNRMSILETLLALMRMMTALLPRIRGSSPLSLNHFRTPSRFRVMNSIESIEHIISTSLRLTIYGRHS